MMKQTCSCVNKSLNSSGQIDISINKTNRFQSSKIKLLLFNLFFVVTLSFVILSCDDNGSGTAKSISGRAGELLVVISAESWDTTPGKLIRDLLAQPHVSLPQDEPLFNLINVPHDGFKSILKSTRNIVQISISQNVDKEGIEFRDNAWAYPQATVLINAKTHEEFGKIFSENQSKIMSYFLLAERKRLTSAYEKLYENSVYNVLDKEFNVTLKVPPGFVVSKKDKDFLWARYETNEISQGILVFTFPYVSDSTFTSNYLLQMQDSILKANIPGPIEGSYMKSEERVEHVFNQFEHNKNYASEIRGLWTLERGFMGGPFILLSELDASNNRVVNVYGYVYAPSKEKRNLLRQVEAMMYTLKMNKQAENDKIKSQINMGN